MKMSFFSKLKIGRDDGGYVTDEIPWGSIEQLKKIVLDNGVEKTLAVPTWAFRFLTTIAPGGVVWVGHGSTPLVIATDNFVNEVSHLNPIVRPLFDAANDPITTLRFLSENDTWAHVYFFKRNDADPTK